MEQIKLTYIRGEGYLALSSLKKAEERLTYAKGHPGLYNTISVKAISNEVQRRCGALMAMEKLMACNTNITISTIRLLKDRALNEWRASKSEIDHGKVLAYHDLLRRFNSGFLSKEIVVRY